MTRKQALEKLRTGEPLSTEMLKPLGMTFEHFLRAAQLPEPQYQKIIAKIISHYDGVKA